MFRVINDTTWRCLHLRKLPKPQGSAFEHLKLLTMTYLC